jgi:hypothetical protein
MSHIRQAWLALFPAIFGHLACSVFWRFLKSIRSVFIWCPLRSDTLCSSVLARRSDRATICPDLGFCRRSFCRYSLKPLCTRLRHGRSGGDCYLFGNLPYPRFSPPGGCTCLVSGAISSRKLAPAGCCTSFTVIAVCTASLVSRLVDKG